MATTIEREGSAPADPPDVEFLAEILDRWRQAPPDVFQEMELVVDCALYPHSDGTAWDGSTQTLVRGGGGVGIDTEPAAALADWLFG